MKKGLLRFSLALCVACAMRADTDAEVGAEAKVETLPSGMPDGDVLVSYLPPLVFFTPIQD